MSEPRAGLAEKRKADELRQKQQPIAQWSQAMMVLRFGAVLFLYPETKGVTLEENTESAFTSPNAAVAIAL